MTLPEQFASMAESIVNGLVQTDYQHPVKIDVAAGVYDCDCNGIVGFVLKAVAPDHYALIPGGTPQHPTLAFEYYMLFPSLTRQAPGGWRRIDFLADARRGDIIAWRFPAIETGENTGHVCFVAETPTMDAAGIRASSGSLSMAKAGRLRFCSPHRLQLSSRSCQFPWTCRTAITGEVSRRDYTLAAHLSGFRGLRRGC